MEHPVFPEISLKWTEILARIIGQYFLHSEKLSWAGEERKKGEIQAGFWDKLRQVADLLWPPNQRNRISLGSVRMTPGKLMIYLWGTRQAETQLGAKEVWSLMSQSTLGSNQSYHGLSRWREQWDQTHLIPNPGKLELVCLILKLRNGCDTFPAWPRNTSQGFPFPEPNWSLWGQLEVRRTGTCLFTVLQTNNVTLSCSSLFLHPTPLAHTNANNSTCFANPFGIF